MTLPGCESIAFPLIATGSFGYPKEEGMRIALDEIMLHVYPSEQAAYSLLSETERGAPDAVIRKFKDYKASEIMEYMHEERAYKETEDGEIIPFRLAGEIRVL